MKFKSVIGLPVAVTDYAGAVSWILEKASLSDRPYAVEAANTHVAALSRNDRGFFKSMKKFDLITPDGMPLVWSINRQLSKDKQLKDRVYGPTLMLKTIAATSQPGSPYRHYFLGGKAETLSRLVNRLTDEFPDIQIAGSCSPPFRRWSDQENHSMIEQIRKSGANLVWVGLGCPKQEHWIAKNKHLLPPAVYFGIGAAFAFHSGEIKQAPLFLQKIGLEWLFRLITEPRRLFKRYFIYNSLFLYYLLKDHCSNKES